MKTKVHVFLAGTPLQVLGAIEACVHYNVPVEKRLLVVGSSQAFKGRPIEQVETAVEFGKWGRVVWVAPAPKLQWTRRYVQVISGLLEELEDVDSVYVGSYRSAVMNHAANALEPNRTVLLDDGIMTLEVGRERRAGNYLLPAPGWLPRATLKLLGVRMSPLRNLEFFTSYRVTGGPNDKVVVCDYPVLRSALHERPTDGTTIVLGTPAVEDGLMNRSNYIHVLEALVTKAGMGPVTYFAHRREREKGLQNISAQLNLNVERPSTCIELELLSRSKLPSSIVGLYSSGLVTSAGLVGDIVQVKAFRVPNAYLATRHRRRVDYAYRMLEKSPGLRVVSLE